MADKKARKVRSTESAKSMIIAGPNARVSYGSGIESTIDTEPVDELFQSASVLLSCPRHKRYALSDVKSRQNREKGLTLPTTLVSNKISFQKAASHLLKQVLANEKSEKGYIQFDKVSVLQKISVQLPGSKKSVWRYIFKGAISMRSNLCCQNNTNKRIRWLTTEEILKHSDALWGPECMFLIFYALGSRKKRLLHLVEMPITRVTFLPGRSQPKNDAERLIAQLYTEQDVLRILSDFIQHSYPERFMCKKSLLSYLKACGWFPQNAKLEEANVFRAFAGKRPYVQFQDFLLGLAASDKNVKHDGVAGHVRALYISRYYHVSDPSKITEILKQKGIIVGQSFRGNKSFKAATRDNFVYDPIDVAFDPRAGNHREGVEDQKCDICLQTKVTIGPYGAKIMRRYKNYGSMIADPKPLDLPDNRNVDPALKERVQRNVDGGRFERRLLQSFPKLDWLHKPEAAENLIRLCRTVFQTVKSEQNLISIPQPCYIIGSVAGREDQMNDLIRVVCPRMPFFEIGSFLFLGNYSAKDAAGLKCIIFLLANKCLCPNRFFLLKGAAEVSMKQALQTQISRYITNAEVANKVAQELFVVLDHLPVAAAVNRDVLCVSSGVPKSAEHMNDINDASGKVAGEILSLNAVNDGEAAATAARLGYSKMIRSGTESFNPAYKSKGIVITLSAASSNKAAGVALIAKGKISLATIEIKGLSKSQINVTPSPARSSISKPGSSSTSKPKSNPGSESKPKSNPGSTSKPKSNPGSEPRPKSYPGSEPKPKSNPGSEPRTKSNPGSEPKPKSRPG